MHDRKLKLCTTAPPVDGKANTAIIQLLARFFGLPKSAVRLKSGGQSRNKSFNLKGLTLDEARTVLTKTLAPINGINAITQLSQGEKR